MPVSVMSQTCRAARRAASSEVLERHALPAPNAPRERPRPYTPFVRHSFDEIFTIQVLLLEQLRLGIGEFHMNRHLVLDFARGFQHSDCRSVGHGVPGFFSTHVLRDWYSS